MKSGFKIFLVLTLALAGWSPTARANPNVWCQDLLRRPIGGRTRNSAAKKLDRVLELDDQIRELDDTLRRSLVRRPRLEKRRENLWRAKIEARQELLKLIEKHPYTNQRQLMLVREVLDAHVKALEALKAYLDQLRYTSALTNLALFSQISEFVASFVWRQFDYVFKYLVVAVLAVHSQEVTKTSGARQQVEMQFLRLRELLLIQSDETIKNFPRLKGRLPYSVLGLGLIDALRLTKYLAYLTRPFELGDVLTTINTVRLAQNVKIIRHSTAEVIQVTKELHEISADLECAVCTSIVHGQAAKAPAKGASQALQ